TDEEVLTLSVHCKNHYNNGALRSVTRTLRVGLGTPLGTRERLELVTKFKPGASDPLGSLQQRLSNRLLWQAEAELEKERPVKGECWNWEKGELTIREKQHALTCPVREVTAVDVVAGHVCVWREGREEVWARIPEGSANAQLLEQLLTKEI